MALSLRTQQRRAVAIGTFDGVHRGHRAVISRLGETGLVPTAITFDPHPRTVLGSRRVGLLCSVDRRVALLRAAGAHDVVVLPFSEALSRLSPAAWIEQTLLPLGTEAVAVGADFRFGLGRRGDVSTFADFGLQVLATPLVPEVSSSAIRRRVASGDVEGAAALLGRDLDIDVTIDRAALTDNGGATLRLGLRCHDAILPATGAYWARVDDQPGLLRVDDRARLGFVTPQGVSGWRPGCLAHLVLHRRYAPAVTT